MKYKNLEVMNVLLKRTKKLSLGAIIIRHCRHDLSGQWQIGRANGSCKGKLPSDSRQPQYFSAGTFAYTLQAFIMYFFSGMLKTGSQWYPDGTAGHLALRMEGYVTPLGDLALKTMPRRLLEAGTIYTYFLELLGPFLVWIPCQYAR
eukprot:scaffold429910_cov33-Prasinocladus_malaysianus.AAC.2